MLSLLGTVSRGTVGSFAASVSLGISNAFGLLSDSAGTVVLSVAVPVVGLLSKGEMVVEYA